MSEVPLHRPRTNPACSTPVTVSEFFAVNEPLVLLEHTVPGPLTSNSKSTPHGKSTISDSKSTPNGKSTLSDAHLDGRLVGSLQQDVLRLQIAVDHLLGK